MRENNVETYMVDGDVGVIIVLNVENVFTQEEELCGRLRGRDAWRGSYMRGTRRMPTTHLMIA